VAIAPAMDLDMYQHPTTKSNLQILANHQVQIIPAGVGELASGLSGEGRMAEPEEIIEFLQKQFNQPKKGKAVISAGPTFEAIDPVRFIGNHSSGKMGFALAHEAANRGWDVTLVTGPTSQEIVDSSIQRIDVVSAEEMLSALSNEIDGATLLIMSAAVADYKPKFVADQKIKKAAAEATIELEPTTDILATLGAQKKEHQCFVGFALETENELTHAQGKLERKNLDFIVLNSLNNQGAGFGHDTNKITIIGKDTKPVEFELKSKEAVAYDIFNHIDENHNS
jgi:phosphopantothenoylcysteine decarboxylase/phosphopantothenate--cysteine ligase